MNDIFIGILNNALIASLLIIAVILARFIIKRAPKWIACTLWGFVAVRLVLPFDIESIFSLVPNSKPIPSDIEYSATPHIETGFDAINQVVNPVLAANFSPKAEDSVNPLQIVISVFSYLWMIGIICLLLYLLISYFILRKKVAASQKIYRNVFICDEVSSPFILGIVKPRIYLPSGLSADAMECVLEHERTHLKRWDHLWKPLGFIILSVYWFNPLCWVAYVLLCKDIELACDEKVTKDKDKNWKATYCKALLDCNAQRRAITACPVAFGEVSVKERIKTVLNYKKPTFWIVVIALVISAIVAVCFMTNPMNDSLILSEGNFDNIMGYSGHYIYYDGYPTEGFYYASDGTLLAHVWGTVPEDVGVIDLDGDGKNELIAGLMWADGATDVVVYKEFENGVRYASCSELLEDPYDNFGVGSLIVEYLKDTNEVKFSYWIDVEQSYRTSTHGIYLYYAFTWLTPDWLETPVDEIKASEFWGDQRDWTCGNISEIISDTINGTELMISLQYFISPDDSEMIRKLGLTQEDFTNGYDIEPMGETRIYPISKNCAFIFIDSNHTFDNDSRVKSYDEVHVITEDFAVFQEYLDTYKKLSDYVFFYDIRDEEIKAIYETWLP